MRKTEGLWYIEERATLNAALHIAIKPPVVGDCVYSQAEQLVGFMSELHVHICGGMSFSMSV